MSKFRVGAWALESELAEAEERECAEAAAAAPPVSSFGNPMLLAGQPSQSFPSLQEAIKKPKKKKAIPMSISEFNTGTHVGPGGALRAPAFKYKSPAPGEMLHLPKKFTPITCFARQERSGYFGNGGTSKVDDSDNWFSGKKSTAHPPNGYSGFEPGFSESRISDADFNRGIRGSGSSHLSNVERERPRLILDPPKRDSALQQDPILTKPSPFGSARPREEVLAKKGLDWRKMEIEIEAKRGLSPTSSQLSRPSSVQSSKPSSPASLVSVESVAPNPRPKVSPFGDAKPREVILEEKRLDWRKMETDIEAKRALRSASSQSSRPSSVQSSKPGSPTSQVSVEVVAPKSRPKVNPFGDAKPREVLLEEKGLDWRKMETEIEAKRALRPTYSHSSKPSSVQSSKLGSPASSVSREAVAPMPRPKVSPFGDAKPREVLLEEKGMDWRKIDRDLEHRGVDRPETVEEKILKEEINQLKNLAKKIEREADCDSAPSSTEQISSLRGQTDQKEKELNQLIQHLDDKVRFGQRDSIDIRTGSESGRIPFSAYRPPSQSCISNDLKNLEFMQRPSSRGMSDIRCKPLDEQHIFQRSRHRDLVFLFDRSLDRSSKIPRRW